MTRVRVQALLSAMLAAVLLTGVPSGSAAAATLIVNPSGDVTGTTDTAAVQTALNTVGAQGGTVRFGSGTFYLARPVTLAVAKGVPLVTLTGAGANGPNATVFASVRVTPAPTDISPVLQLDSSADLGQPGDTIDVSGLTIDGARDGNVSDGIKAWNSTGLRLHDLAVRDLTTSANILGVVGIRLGNTVHSSIERSAVTGIDPNAAYTAGIQVRSGSSDVGIGDNTVDSVGSDGINCANETTSHSTDIRVERNTVTHTALSGNGFGIELYTNCDGSVVQDNGTAAPVDHGISAVNSTGVAIRRNFVAGGNYGIESGGPGVRDTVIADNSVTGAVLGLSLQDTTHAAVLRDHFTSSADYGAWLKNDDHLDVSGVGCADTSCGFANGHPATGTCTAGTHPTGALYVEADKYLTLDGLDLSQPGGYGINFVGSDNGGTDYLSTVGNSFHDNDCGPISRWLGPSQVSWSSNSGATPPCYLDAGAQPPGAFECASIGTWPGWHTPTAVIKIPSTARAGQPVSYRVNAQASSGATVSYVLVDPGAGVPVSAPSAPVTGTVTFPRPGSYPVSAVVWDSNGRSTLTTVTVLVS